MWRGVVSSTTVRSASEDVERLRPGEFLCLQGEEAKAIYILETGDLRETIVPGEESPSEDEVRARGRVVGHVREKGSVAGISGAVLGKRTSSVVAASDASVRVLRVSPGGLKAAAVKTPSLALILARALARRLREMNCGLRLATNYVERIESCIGRHCLRFRALVRRLEQVPELLGICANARESWSFRRGEEAARVRNETREFVRSMRPGRRLRAGEYLCREGEWGDEMYVVVSGTFEVVLGGRVIDVVRRGDILGEMAALLSKRPSRTAAVRTAEPSRVAVIPSAKLAETVEKNPLLGLQLVLSLSKRLENSARLLCEFERSVHLALDRLDGAQNSCGSDLRALSTRVSTFPEAAGKLLSAPLQALAAVKENHQHFLSEVNEKKVLEASGYAFRELRGRHEFALAEQRLDSLFRTLYGARDIYREELEELFQMLLGYLPLDSSAHIDPRRARPLAFHCAAVAVWAAQVCRRLGLGDEETKAAALGGLVHDVGVLERAGGGPFDYTRHTEYARRYIPRIVGLAPEVARIAYEHEELADGSGYPRGLSSSDVSAGTLVVSAADDLDESISAGEGPDAALQALRARGGAYDAAVLETLDEIVREVGGRC